jgi:dihydrofolate reductase
MAPTEENAMGKLIISENVTLDGVMEDPTGEEGSRFGGWFNQIGDTDRAAWAEVLTAEAVSAEAFLIGRHTYEYLSARWIARTGVWADRLNTMPKYVVSSTLTDPEWTSTTVLSGDAVEEVAKLKQNLAGEIVLAASGVLAPTLIEHDLVDEYRLIVYPVALGTGGRLFHETTAKKPLRLLEARTLGENLVLLRYSADQ